MNIDMKKTYEKELKEEFLTPSPLNKLEYKEEELLEKLDSDFEYKIKQRGIDYYETDQILKVCKKETPSKITYISKVYGNIIKPYDVKIEIDSNGINYSCTCPYEYPCKHEYAVLKAIDNCKYEEITIKPTIKEKTINMKNIIKSIPAEELKNYIISTGNEMIFNDSSFSDYFRKYYPIQKYEYYYNNLYNALIFENEYKELIIMYLSRINQYISGDNYLESFKIIRSIIDAYHDSKKINTDDCFIDILPKIGMYLRVIYRKSNKSIQEQIDTWISKLEKAKYYNNYYLEDIILSIK